MLSLIRLLSYFTLLFLILSCSNEDNNLTENETQFAQKIISSTSLYKYELLTTAPIHTQTSMLTKYQNLLYRFGSRSPVQIFDLNSKSDCNEPPLQSTMLARLPTSTPNPRERPKWQ